MQAQELGAALNPRADRVQRRKLCRCASPSPNRAASRFDPGRVSHARFGTPTGATLALANFARCPSMADVSTNAGTDRREQVSPHDRFWISVLGRRLHTVASAGLYHGIDRTHPSSRMIEAAKSLKIEPLYESRRATRSPGHQADGEEVGPAHECGQLTGFRPRSWV